jgi:hypothetical protein
MMNLPSRARARVPRAVLSCEPLLFVTLLDMKTPFWYTITAPSFHRPFFLAQRVVILAH